MKGSTGTLQHTLDLKKEDIELYTLDGGKEFMNPRVPLKTQERESGKERSSLEKMPAVKCSCAELENHHLLPTMPSLSQQESSLVVKAFVKEQGTRDRPLVMMTGKGTFIMETFTDTS